MPVSTNPVSEQGQGRELQLIFWKDGLPFKRSARDARARVRRQTLDIFVGEQMYLYRVARV